MSSRMCLHHSTKTSQPFQPHWRFASTVILIWNPPLLYLSTLLSFSLRSCQVLPPLLHLPYPAPSQHHGEVTCSLTHNFTVVCSVYFALIALILSFISYDCDHPSVPSAIVSPLRVAVILMMCLCPLQLVRFGRYLPLSFGQWSPMAVNKNGASPPSCWEALIDSLSPWICWIPGLLALAVSSPNIYVNDLNCIISSGYHENLKNV